MCCAAELLGTFMLAVSLDFSRVHPRPWSVSDSMLFLPVRREHPVSPKAMHMPHLRVSILGSGTHVLTTCHVLDNSSVFVQTTAWKNNYIFSPTHFPTILAEDRVLSASINGDPLAGSYPVPHGTTTHRQPPLDNKNMNKEQNPQLPSGALFSFFGKGSPFKSTNQKRMPFFPMATGHLGKQA